MYKSSNTGPKTRGIGLFSRKYYLLTQISGGVGKTVLAYVLVQALQIERFGMLTGVVY